MTIKYCLDDKEKWASTSVHLFQGSQSANPYVMHIADMQVDAAAKHGVVTFMDGHSGYNQILWLQKIYTKRCSDVLELLGYMNGQ